MKRLVAFAFLPACWLAACSGSDSDQLDPPAFPGPTPQLPGAPTTGDGATPAAPGGNDSAPGTPTGNTEGPPPVAGVDMTGNDGTSTPAGTGSDAPVTDTPPAQTETPPVDT